MTRPLRALTATIVAAFTATATASAQDVAVASTLRYRQLRQARYAVDGVAVPKDGIELTLDTVAFRLDAGAIRPMEPVGGVVTGFVFTGTGRLRVEVPNAFERAQLKRFSRDDKTERIDSAFSTLIVRSVDPRVVQPAAPPPGARYAPHSLAHERHESWLKDWGLDVDARIIAATLNPHDAFFIADVKTKDYGWLSVRFEPWDAEELTVAKLPGAGTMVETWVSLDQARERDAQGNPTSDTPRMIDVTHATIAADLGNHRGQLLLAGGPALPDPIAFRVKLSFTALVDGLQALPFELAGLSEVSEVRADDGSKLAFLRDTFGRRYALIADEQSVGSLIVLLEPPLRAGESVAIEFAYTMRTLNFVSGRSWYPGPPDAFRDRHTAEVTVRGPARQQVRAVGELVSDTIRGDRRTSVWVVDHPTKMYGFSFGAQFKEETIKLEGAPEVLVFGVSTGAVFGKMVRNVAVDVARSMKFFQDYFDRPLPSSRLRATAISGYHGEAFEGFLHLSQESFNREHPGHTERFRAHEVAHQYWGHMVGWKSYRDQWLSEAFAEYSALLFVEAVLPKEKHFDPMIADDAAFQLGSLKGGTVMYWPAYVKSITLSERADLGPIAAGYRASTARVPYGYVVQVYEKGPLVLHTVRTVLSSMSRDQDLFRGVLQEFVKTYEGRDASTADFLRLLEERAPFPWGPFFEAYVWGTEIPTFAWRWSLGGEGGKGILNVSIRASHVPEGFVLPIPLAIDFGDGNIRYTFVLMDGTDKTFHIPVPSTPVGVKLNPRNGVLARIEALK